jgi:Glycosyltransferase family 87
MSPTVASAAAARSAGGRWAGVARLVVATLALLLLANLLVQITWGLDAPPKTDYLPFATGARVLSDQPSCTYCMDVQASEQAAILGYVPTAGFPKPYVNPPLVALLLRPLSGLPLRTGLTVLLVVLLVALACSARLVDRLLPHSLPGWLRLLLLALSLLSLPAATALGLAQWAPLLVLAALGALACLRSGRPVLAGLLLSVLVVKPQTVWLVVPLLAAVGAWRVLGGFALGSAGWVLTGLALVGPHQLLQWPRLVLERHVDEAFRTAGLPGIVTAVTGSGEAAFAAAVVLAGVAVLAGFLLRSRLRGRPEWAVAAGVAVSLACAPHVFPDDLMLLAVPVVVWAPLAPRACVAALLGLSAAYEVDGWLPSSWAHLTALASVAVAAGMLAALFVEGGTRQASGGGGGLGSAVRVRSGVEGAAPSP